MHFVYQARDLTGDVRHGQFVATCEDDARKQLRKDGLFLLSIAEGTPPKPAPQLFSRRIRRKDVIHMTTQLAVMIDAGVSITEALSGLADHTDHPGLKKILNDICHDVEGGEALSAALAKHPKQFDRTYVNLVKASEASGTLSVMLDRIASQMRGERETQQKVTSAMIYPAAMLLMCCGTCIFLLAFVFPKITPMFETRGLELPTATRVMMTLSHVLVNHTVVCLAAAAVLIAALAWARTQPWGRRILDWGWISVPILGPLCRMVSLGRSLRTLATCVNAGVPMLEAIQLSAGVSNNTHYETSWLRIGEQVASGRQIHEALSDDPLFPSTVRQMINSGEKTGKLGIVLNRLADHFDREVAMAIKSATSMIEPMMVAVMGGVIGTIALAILLPVFKLSTQGVH